jgi:hypothetical protein
MYKCKMRVSVYCLLVLSRTGGPRFRCAYVDSGISFVEGLVSGELLVGWILLLQLAGVGIPEAQ